MCGLYSFEMCAKALNVFSVLLVIFFNPSSQMLFLPFFIVQYIIFFEKYCETKKQTGSYYDDNIFVF